MGPRLLIIRKRGGYQRPQSKDDTSGRGQDQGGGQGIGQIFHPWPDREPPPEMFQKVPKFFGHKQDNQEKPDRRKENIYHERHSALFVQAGKAKWQNPLRDTPPSPSEGSFREMAPTWQATTINEPQNFAGPQHRLKDRSLLVPLFLSHSKVGQQLCIRL